jgi:hypothetical protein
MHPIAGVLTAACFILASCTADTNGASAPLTAPESSSASVTTLDCANGVSTDLRARDLQVVLGVVALPASPRAAALGTGRLGERDQPRLFAKSALLVRPGDSFELLAGEAPPRSLAFSWSPHTETPTPTRSLVVSGCRSTYNSKWLAFIGGYYVNRASCATLIVRTATSQRRVRIGLGEPCPRQRPPQGPSER